MSDSCALRTGQSVTELYSTCVLCVCKLVHSKHYISVARNGDFYNIRVCVWSLFFAAMIPSYQAHLPRSPTHNSHVHYTCIIRVFQKYMHYESYTVHVQYIKYMYQGVAPAFTEGRGQANRHQWGCGILYGVTV